MRRLEVLSSAVDSATLIICRHSTYNYFVGNNKYFFEGRGRPGDFEKGDFVKFSWKLWWNPFV